MLHKLYIGRATKGENFTKTMKRERVNLKEDSHKKKEEKSDKKDKKEEEKEEKVNL